MSDKQVFNAGEGLRAETHYCIISVREMYFLKVMHYNVALPPKKKYLTMLIFYGKQCYVTFELLFKSGQGLLVCF